jgi:hypothetical protein
MASRGKLRFAFSLIACLYFVTAMASFSMAAARPHFNGHKVKITGPIVVRDGNEVQIRDAKDGSVHGFIVTDRTAIKCDKGFLHGNTVMDASALVPALTVEVEGIGTPEGVREARTIKFTPDPFVLTASQDDQSRDLCRRPVQQNVGRSHGMKTVFSSLLPM